MMIPHRISRESDTKIRVTTIRETQMVINCSIKQYQKGVEKYNKGALIQDAFPNLSVDEREFLLSGLTPDQWKDIFPEEVK